jgi:hypothetical protein
MVPLEAVIQIQVPHQPDFDSEVLAPLRVAQKAAQEAEAARLEQVKRDEEAAAAAQKAAEEAAAVTVVTYVKPVYAAPPQAVSGDLTGSIGFAIPGGNCVLQIPVGLRPFGDPITWVVTTQTPYIGAVALFNYNHTGMVVGIWSNGDLEIAHQNFTGGLHRFSRSEFRGFR